MQYSEVLLAVVVVQLGLLDLVIRLMSMQVQNNSLVVSKDD